MTSKLTTQPTPKFHTQLPNHFMNPGRPGMVVKSRFFPAATERMPRMEISSFRRVVSSWFMWANWKMSRGYASMKVIVNFCK